MENDNANGYGDINIYPQEMFILRDTMNQNSISTLSSGTVVEENRSFYDDSAILSTAPEWADVGEAQHSAKPYPDACPDTPESHTPQYGCSTVPCSGRSGFAYTESTVYPSLCALKGKKAPPYESTCTSATDNREGSQLEENTQDSMSPQCHSTDDSAISGESGYGTPSSVTNHLSRPTTTDSDFNPPAKDLNPQPDHTAATGHGQSSSVCFHPTSTSVAEEPNEDSVNVSTPSMNIVIFGETGVGKSSVINLIAGEKRAHTSNTALGCTFKHERYNLKVDGVACALWDTSGLDEGDEGAVPAGVAERNLRALMGELAHRGGIQLLIYCIRGTRLTNALKHNYDLFYAEVCRRKVPVALVVTCLEHQEGEMETWWHANERRLRQSGMRFDAHACVTTLDVKDQTIQKRRSESQSRLHELVLEYSKRPPWKIEQSFLSWIFSIFPGVLKNTLSAGGLGKTKTMRKVIICDVATNPQTLIQVSPGITALCPRLSGVIRHKQYEFVMVDKHTLETAWQHREDAGMLVFYTSALVGNEIPQEDVAALKTFYDNAGGHVCPVIVVLRGCNDQETALKAWRGVTLRHNNITADVNFLPTTEDPQFDKLNDIIEKCIEHYEVREPKAGMGFFLTVVEAQIPDVAEFWKKLKHFLAGTRTPESGEAKMRRIIATAKQPAPRTRASDGGEANRRTPAVPTSTLDDLFSGLW